MNKDIIAWIDLETTGLDPEQDVILEVAMVITDNDLRILDEWTSVVRHNLQDLRMNDWCWKQHTASGLLEEVSSVEAVPLYEVDNTIGERLLLARGGALHLKLRSSATWAEIDAASREQLAEPVILAGSTISFDRAFIQESMPELLRQLHYRNFDVSVMREAARRWWPDAEIPEKAEIHRALPDIHDSIAMARWFRDRMNSGSMT